MRILHFSTLFPNLEMPQRGIFVAERIKHLLATGELKSTILAPLPWFPFQHRQFGLYAGFARVPAEELFADSAVVHTRYPVVPKIGMSVAPLLLALGSVVAISRRWKNLDEFDLIDAHYFYPDGVAAIMLGKCYAKPVVITGRGTDLNLIPEFRIPRRWIRWAASHADGLVTVSESLRSQLVALGVAPDQVAILRNGVDLGRFKPLERSAIRKRLGLEGKVALSVGNLVAVKGHDIAIGALAQSTELTLVIAGEGTQRAMLESFASKIGVADRVRFVGRLDQRALIDYYNAADCVVLCSKSEGMANVLLESIATGTPVVATSVGGNPEVVCDPSAGLLFADRSATGLATALEELWKSYPDRAATRRFAERFDWQSTSLGQIRLFKDILASRRELNQACKQKWSR